MNNKSLVVTKNNDNNSVVSRNPAKTMKIRGETQ